MKIWDCPFGREHKTKPCVLVEDLVIELDKIEEEGSWKAFIRFREKLKQDNAKSKNLGDK